MRDKLARLMFVRVGSNLPPVRKVEDDARRVADLLEQAPLGGLIVFNGDCAETPHTLAELQRRSSRPLLVAADLERGIGQQLLGFPLFPHAMAFDQLGDEAEELVEEFALVTAMAMRRAGIHINFAPVADVHSEPRNPIIATRAFSGDPRRAAQLAAAFVRGTQAGGAFATAKHFPGHGNTEEDSHHVVPTVAATRDELDACELIPFRQCIAAGAPLVMSAHVRYPDLDPSGKPATLSKPILVDLLRGELEFDGVVVSDSLLMEGVAGQFDDEGALAVATILGGVDLLLDVANPISTLAALEQAVVEGRLPRRRVEQAFERVEALAQRMENEPAEQAPLEALRERTSVAIASAARRAVTVVVGQAGQVELSPRRGLLAVMIKPFDTAIDPPQQPLAAALADAFPNSEYREMSPQTPADQRTALLAEARGAEQLLVAFIVKPAAWHAFGLPSELRDWVTQAIAGREAVAACLGAAEGIQGYPASASVCTFSDVPASQQALVEVLCGQES